MQKEFNDRPAHYDNHIFQASPGTLPDISGILHILRLNWYEIYKGKVDKAALDGFIETVMRPLYKSILQAERPDRAINTMRTRSGILCGFTCHGLKHDAHEIQAIYVAPAYVQKSIGGMLMISAAESMMRADDKINADRPVHIRICTDNVGAQSFAAKLNGVILRTETRPFAGATITDQIIGWKHPGVLHDAVRERFNHPMQALPMMQGGSEIFPPAALAIS